MLRSIPDRIDYLVIFIHSVHIRMWILWNVINFHVFAPKKSHRIYYKYRVFAIRNVWLSAAGTVNHSVVFNLRIETWIWWKSVCNQHSISFGFFFCPLEYDYDESWVITFIRWFILAGFSLKWTHHHVYISSTFYRVFIHQFFLLY